MNDPHDFDNDPVLMGMSSPTQDFVGCGCFILMMVGAIALGILIANGC